MLDSIPSLRPQAIGPALTRARPPSHRSRRTRPNARTARRRFYIVLHVVWQRELQQHARVRADAIEEVRQALSPLGDAGLALRRDGLAVGSPVPGDRLAGAGDA